MNQIIQERIRALRALIDQKGIDLYLVPSGDSHQSEYTGEYFKAREFITGFTGSAGTAVITRTKAGLWTDGRYFLQADKQLEGTGVELFRMGEPGVPAYPDYIADAIPSGGVLGFDGRVVSMESALSLESLLSPKGATISCQEDLIGQIWEERPALSTKPAFALDICYAGESIADKLKRVRARMEAAGTQLHLLSSLDDICWLLNLRGDDVKYAPLLLSYALITPSVAQLYVDADKLSPEIEAALLAEQIYLRPYEAVYEDMRELAPDQKILLDPARTNYALYQNIPDKTRIVCQENPEVLMKSVKNEVELENIRKAHVKDGVALTKFMIWLKKNAGREAITELSASRKLEEFRREQDGFLQPSFAPICGFGPHGAIVHYSATPESDCPVTEGNLFLTDTGGGYLQGSTDITRTFVLGDVPKYMKEDFTTVLRCNLHLARAVFPYGTTGYSLDVLAREPVWARGKNYNHGTGHGVGYLLNIHEAPAGFHKQTSSRTPLEPGMVVTDEPGIYEAGSHGIRTENELIVREGETTAYGRFLYFEVITYVPIDLDGVLPEMLTDEEKAQLNAYHQMVYDTIAPHLDEEERACLRAYTRPV